MPATVTFCFSHGCITVSVVVPIVIIIAILVAIGVFIVFLYKWCCGKCKRCLSRCRNSLRNKKVPTRRRGSLSVIFDPVPKPSTTDVTTTKGRDIEANSV